MRAKTRALPVQHIALIFRPVVIQTRFTGGNHFRMREHSDQLVIRRLMHIGIVRVRADRAIDMRMRLDDRTNPLPILDINADRQGTIDLVHAHMVQQLRQILVQIWEINMTMAIYKHSNSLILFKSI